MENLTYKRTKKTMQDGSIYNLLKRYNDRTLSNYELKKGLDGVIYNCNSDNNFCYKTTLLNF